MSVASAIPLLLDHQAWLAFPLEAIAVALLATAVGVRLLVRPGAFQGQPEPSSTPWFVWMALALLIVGYAAGVGWATVVQHRLLETRAYDLGIMENVLWHTCQGRWLESSLEGGNHLGVHTSFVLLVLAPLYCLFPRAETLLLAQAGVFAIAAWPLFLVGRTILGRSGPALLVSALYLIHPASLGANFYDFHELAFAPTLFFAAYYLLLRARWSGFWVFVALLLSVKEDMAIIVALLGAACLLELRYRLGVALMGLGGVAYLLLQGVVIPFFAGGPHSYAWYFGDLVTGAEGPKGVVLTGLISPIQTLGHALAQSKLTYLAQLLAPVAVLGLLSRRSALLMSYGLALALLADREPLFRLGFQYALYILPFAFVGTLELVARVARSGSQSPWFNGRGLLAGVTCMSLVVAYHFGPLGPADRFLAGFRVVSFDYGSAERARFEEVRALSAAIPPGASVTASETLVPHVARRQRLQTLRYAAAGRGRDFDYYLVLRREIPEYAGQFPEVFSGSDYAAVRAGEHAILYRRTRPHTGSSDPDP